MRRRPVGDSGGQYRTGSEAVGRRPPDRWCGGDGGKNGGGHRRPGRATPQEYRRQVRGSLARRSGAARSMGRSGAAERRRRVVTVEPVRQAVGAPARRPRPGPAVSPGRPRQYDGGSKLLWGGFPCPVQGHVAPTTRGFTIEYKRTMGARKVPMPSGATTLRIWAPPGLAGHAGARGIRGQKGAYRGV